MAGLANLLFLGQPDPARQLALALSGQQPQPPQGAPPQGAAPPGAIPPPPGGAAADPNAAPGADPNPAPGQPPPPGSPPQPQALQSTPDMSASYSQLANPPSLMSLYLQLDARNRASDQINRGLALIAANHSAPSMRQSIMESVGGGADAGSTVNNLMTLYSGQQQMAAQQQMLAQSPQIAQQLGMPEGVVRAEIMAGRGADLVRSMEPTDAMRNYQQARTMLKQAGVPDDQIDTYTRPMLLGAGSNPAMSEYIQRIAEAQRTGTMAQHPELAGGFYTWQKSIEAQQAQTLDKQKQINDAQGQFGALNGVLSTMNGTTEDLQKKFAAGQLDKFFEPGMGAIYKEAATNGWASALNSAVNWFGGKGVALTDEDKNNLKNILELSQTPMQSLTATSPRHLAPSLGTIGTALAPIADLSRGQKGWGQKLDDLHNQIQNTMADLYGGSGQAPPDNLKLKMNPIYAAGGSMNLRPAQPMSEADIAKDVAYVQQNPSELANTIKFEKAGNLDTTELERRLNQIRR